MRPRPTRRWLAVMVLLGAMACAPAQAFFYEPFSDPATMKPTDELEERIWHEAEVARSQFVRGQPQGATLGLQQKVHAVLTRQWRQWAPNLRVHVIDNADVLAVSSANGDLILSTGMLLRLDTEDELQVVLAREIAHVVQRHAVRSVYAARVGAGANVLFQAAVRANSFIGTVGLLSSFQVTPDMLLADGGKAFFQAQIGKLRDNMADNFIRRVSATGFDAMVKTSLFGYSESLESEADDFAIEELQRKGIDPAVFVTVMQRLHDEAAVDEKKFSAFYANAGRMAERVSTGKKAVARHAAEKATSAANDMAAPASPTVAAVPAGDTAEPGAVPVAAPTSPAETVTAAAASEAPKPAKPDGDGDGLTVVELPTMGSVAAVVIAGALEAASDSGGEGAAAPVVAGAAEAAANASAAASEAASETPPEGTVESTAESAAEDLAKAATAQAPSPAIVTAALAAEMDAQASSAPSAEAVAASTGARPVSAASERSYQELLASVAMSVFEAELDAGHLNRAIRNIERGRQNVPLPPRHRLLLAESCWAHPEAQQAQRGETLVKAYLQDHPDDHRAHKLLGLIALKRGQLPQAREHLENAHRLAPSDDERGFIEQYLRRTEQKLKASL